MRGKQIVMICHWTRSRLEKRGEEDIGDGKEGIEKEWTHCLPLTFSLSLFLTNSEPIHEISIQSAWP